LVGSDIFLIAKNNPYRSSLPSPPLPILSPNPPSPRDTGGERGGGRGGEVRGRSCLPPLRLSSVIISTHFLSDSHPPDSGQILVWTTFPVKTVETCSQCRKPPCGDESIHGSSPLAISESGQTLTLTTSKFNKFAFVAPGTLGESVYTLPRPTNGKGV